MEKINIAELLKDCPKGMELDCTMYDNCTYAGIEDVGYIDILINTPSGRIRLTKEGCYIRHDDNAKCVIFPKGKNTWEGFHRPFRDGDIITCNNSACTFVSIFKDKPTERSFRKHCSFILDYNRFLVTTKFADYTNPRFATEEEKAKLFQAIKDNGYKWNPETKTLEKLIEQKFKVGDRVKKKDSNEDVVLITDIADNYYIVETKYGMEVTISMSIQNNYELVPNKFDINTLKPFDKVFVRDNNTQEWVISFFSHCNGLEIYKYSCINGHGYAQCVPYEENKHLLGTTNDCDDFYKTWEK